MIVPRWIAASLRQAAACLLLLAAAASAQAAGADYLLELDGVPGEIELSSFEIAGPGEAPRLGMLLPAVQKVREAASRGALLDLGCDGTTAGAHIPKATLTCRKQGKDGPYFVVELFDVQVTSAGYRGGVRVAAGDVNGDGLSQRVELTFARATWSWPETGESLQLDCAAGPCHCAR